MPTTLTIHRNGSFLHRHLPGGKCGLEGTVQYLYKASISVEGELKPPQYFIVDNGTIQAYFEQAYARPAKGLSCEVMARRAVEDLWEIAEREGGAFLGVPSDMRRGIPKWFKVTACRVLISGNGGVSWLECKQIR